jgi:hypothetical protein
LYPNQLIASDEWASQNASALATCAYGIFSNVAHDADTKRILRDAIYSHENISASKAYFFFIIS